MSSADYDRLVNKLEAAEAECERLTRERDDARAERDVAFAGQQDAYAQRDFYKAQCDVTTYVERTDALMRERDDANERARLAIVRADIVQRERDEARAELASTRADLHLGLKTNVAMQDDIDRLKALLREALDWIGLESQTTVVEQELRTRIKAALEERA